MVMKIRRRSVWIVFAAAAMLICAAIALPSRPGAAPELVGQDPAEIVVGAVHERVAEPDRRCAAPGAVRADAGERRGQRGFDAIYRDLVALFAEARPQGVDRGSAAGRASQLFAEMVTAEPRAGERALAVLAGLQAPWREPAAVLQRDVCRLLLDFNLQQLTAVPELAKHRSPLVHAMVAQMPIAEDAAMLMAGLLEDRPYLTAEHEPVLVELAQAARQSLVFLAEPVRRLLVTVWTNLGQDHRLHASLLHHLEGEPGVLRDAAVDRLLVDDRYRTRILDRLVLAGDNAAMLRAALQAARALPFPAAIEVLATLKSAAPGSHFGGAYATLAERAPADLAQHYLQRLADLSLPAHREQLVAALGHYAAGQGGAEIALLAFRNDPAVRTRGVALLVIAAGDDTASYCRCFAEAVAAAGADPVWWDYVAASLVNAARRCEVNWLDTAIQQVLNGGRLSERRRLQLEQLRAQYLPR
jgi:hypothetical protein